MPERILVWGASGHAKVVAEIIRLTGIGEIVDYLDDVSPERMGESFAGATVVGGIDDVPVLRERLGVTAMALAVGDCAARFNALRRFQGWGLPVVTAVHPSAIVSPTAHVGAGTVIAAGAIVNPDARIGAAAIINTGASVDHDCVVGDGAHVSPGSRLGGWVHVGEAAWVGIGATVMPRVTIGARAILGAASLARHDIPEDAVAYGVPARITRSSPS